MNGRRPPPLIVFGAVSLGLHLAAGAVSRRSPPAAPTFQAGAQTLSGETLDIEPPPGPAADPETAAAEQAPDPTSTTPRPRLAPTTITTPGSPRPPAGAGSAATAQVAAFGAVGVRYATDLATTFTRAFPQAASADPAWSAAPFGAAGSAEVTITIDDEGRVSSTAVVGSPSPALRRGIERTLAILAPRVFTASASSTRIRVTASVSRDVLHDGLHGDVFALSGGSFSGDLGTAFFALPPGTGVGGEPGRRVDIELRLLPW